MPPKKYLGHNHSQGGGISGQNSAPAADAAPFVPSPTLSQSAAASLHVKAYSLQMSSGKSPSAAAATSPAKLSRTGDRAHAAYDRIGFQTKVEAVAASIPSSKSGVIGNPVIKSIIRGEIEPPAGSSDMGGWKAAVYTAEQQVRLRIDALGNKLLPAPSAEAPAAVSAVATIASELPLQLSSEFPALPIDFEKQTRMSSFSVQQRLFNVTDDAWSFEEPYEMCDAACNSDGSTRPAVPAPCSDRLFHHRHPEQSNAAFLHAQCQSFDGALAQQQHSFPPPPAYCAQRRCMEPITICSPIGTFTSPLGADLNTFLMMAGSHC